MAYSSDDDAARYRGDAILLESELSRLLAAATARLQNLSLSVRRGLEASPEIDCIRHRLPPGVVASAERRALALGVGADEVLVVGGYMSEERYCRSFAFSLGLPFAELDSAPRRFCPVADDTLTAAAPASMLPFMSDGRLIWAIAPRGRGARHLMTLLAAHPDLRARVRITSAGHIRRFVCRHASHGLAAHAAEWLRETHPLYSAATKTWAVPMALASILTLIAAALALAPGATIAVLQIAISLVFLAWTGLRVVGASKSQAPITQVLPVTDGALPVYTIVVALYREARALPGLVAALKALDYPPEKLDVKIVLEADDPQTLLAVEMMRLGAPFEVILAPAAGPRTKPKALNAALPFARGDLIVIYDAEDRPEPDQLRRAEEAFRQDHSGRLACVQARLTIDNTDDGWLASLFTAEYAGQFDVLLPGLASLHLPIPLGGSSNHFRTSVLRAAGGWDPYNVTEDADLGTRLARLGYRAGVIGSTTFEEAPSKAGPWLRQRTRWFKGWLQTWCVHMRTPRRLLRELGLAGFATFQLMIVGTAAAALLQPLAVAIIAWTAVTDGFSFSHTGDWRTSGLNWLHWTALGSGYAVSIILGVIGLARRDLLRVCWVLPLMVAHWALLSVAAWRALFQLLRDPHRWEKTEHGLARTSRRARPRLPIAR